MFPEEYVKNGKFDWASAAEDYIATLETLNLPVATLLEQIIDRSRISLAAGTLLGEIADDIADIVLPATFKAGPKVSGESDIDRQYPGVISGMAALGMAISAYVIDEQRGQADGTFYEFLEQRKMPTN